MLRKTAIGMIVAAGMFGGIQGASAQGIPATANNRDTCVFSSWCWTYVQVSQSSGTPVATLTGGDFRMQKKLSGTTLGWILIQSPDYEFRADSVAMTGANAMGSAAQFPLRQHTATQFAMDNLNSNNLTYTYQVRVYRKGSPPGSAPLTATGSIVNSFN